MAVFLFPENPSNGDVVTNEETGTKYIYQSQYNKWMVALKQPSTSFVDIAGDTMTGPLDIAPADPILGTPAEPSLKIAASPFRNLGSSPDSNFVSTVIRAVDVDDHTLLSLTNTDADNLPIVQGKRSAFRCYAAESLFGITGNQYDVPDGGAEVGFAITGPTATNVSSSAKVLTAFYSSDGSGSSVRYYGRSANSYDLVNKDYVDTKVSTMNIDTGYLPLDGSEPMTGSLLSSVGSGDAINVNSGNFKVGYNGAINMKGGQTITGGNFNCFEGNITVKQSPNNEDGTSATNGRIYTKTNDGTTNFTAFPSGSLQMGQTLSFATTHANKQISGYNNNAAAFIFKLGPTSSASAIERARITMNGTILQGGLDVEGINGQYAAQLKGSVYFPQSSSISVFGEENPYLSFYVGADNSTSKRQVTIYDDLFYVFSQSFNAVDGTFSGALSTSGNLDIGGKFTCSNGGTFGGTSGGTIDYMFNGGTVTFMNSGVKNYSGLWQQNKDTNYLLGNQKKLTFFPDTETESYSGDPVDPILILNGKSKLTEVRQKLVLPKKMSISEEADGQNINTFLNIGSVGHFTIQINDSTQFGASNTVLYVTHTGLVSYQEIAMIGNKKITGLGTCTSSKDAANKAYVDGGLQSLGGSVGSDGTVTNLPFLRKDDAVDTYLNQTDASATYLKISDYVPGGGVVGGLPTTGGTMTGTLSSKLAGNTESYSFQIVDSGMQPAFAVWCPGNVGSQTKLIGRHGTDVWFQNYNASESEVSTTAKFAYASYNLKAQSNVTYAASDAHYFKSNVVFNNGNGDLRAKISNSNFDFYNLGRFKEGFVVKGTGEDIGGTNMFAAYPAYCTYNGRQTNDTDMVNKKYVDDRIAELEARIAALEA